MKLKFVLLLPALAGSVVITSCKTRAHEERVGASSVDTAKILQPSTTDTTLKLDDGKTCMNRLKRFIQSTTYYQGRLTGQSNKFRLSLSIMADGIHEDGNFAFQVYSNQNNGEGIVPAPWDWYEISRNNKLYVVSANGSLQPIETHSSELKYLIDHCIDWNSKD
jgi:hypothetical protein